MNTSTPLKFSLDEPRDTQEFACGEVRVRGWAIPSEGEISIAAKLDNMSWVTISHGKPRADVAAVHSADQHALHSGFNQRIPVPDLKPGEYTFTLRIQSGANDSTEVLRTIKIGCPF